MKISVLAGFGVVIVAAGLVVSPSLARAQSGNQNPSGTADGSPADSTAQAANQPAAPDDPWSALLKDRASGNYKHTGSCPSMDKDMVKQITAGVVADVIVDGQKKIRQSNPMNNPGQATIQIASVLDGALSLACQVDGPAHKKNLMKLKAPERWIQILGANSFLKKTQYAFAIEDYGFYLQQDGKHDQAYPILQKALELDPTFDESYLHLADTQWEMKKFAPAKVNYRTYRHMHIAKYGHGTVPKYVEDRLGM